MKVPKKPKAGQVIVMRNSYHKEFVPEYVDTFKNKYEALTWVRNKLAEEPGDLYMICPIAALGWSTVRANLRRCNGRQWSNEI